MPNPTITLVAESAPERWQAIWWRAVADHWPIEPGSPTLQLLTLEEALREPGRMHGAAAALIVEDADARTLHAFADALHQRGLAGLFLSPPGVALAPGLASDAVVTLPRDAEPAVAGAILATLAQRQPAFESMLQEVGFARRFQSGIRGEMDRVHEELQLAAQVQRDFLPKELPSVPGLDFGALFRPCGYVSGDIYDVVRLDERRVGFFIADAIGHGVPAALMTMVIARTLPMKETSGETTRVVPPGEALFRLNEELIRRQGESPRFASAVYGVIDQRDLRVTIASAGHPWPLRMRDGDIEKIETDGGLLGIFPGEQYPEVSFELRPGETLILHSDGFETAFPEPGADHYGRRLPTSHYVRHFTDLAALVRGGAVMDEAIDRLGRALDAQIGSLHQHDDLTALAITPRKAAGELARPVRHAA